MTLQTHRTLGRVATLVALSACGETTVPVAQTPADGRTIASASTTGEDLKGIPTDGPFPSLADYCRWFARDCTPGDARLCQCEVEAAGPDLAVVRTRDLGRAGPDGMVTDASSMRPAFRRPDGWRVAAVAPTYHVGAETSAGGTRVRAALERAASADVLGDGAPEAIFVMRFVHEDRSTAAKDWVASSTTVDVVVCGDTGKGYCSAAIEFASTSAPSFAKTASGVLTVSGADGIGPRTYRLVVPTTPR